MKRPWLLALVLFVMMAAFMLQNTSTMTGAVTTNTYLSIIANSSLYTPFDKYSPSTNVSLNGSQFSGGTIITIEIRNSTGSVVYGPVNATTTSQGSFTYIWTVGNLTTGNYTIFATDLNNSQLDRNKTIEILPPYTWIGHIINPENSSVRSTVLVYDEFGSQIASDDENYTLTFNYGQLYEIYVYPVNVTGIYMVHYVFMANEGPAGDILVIDDSASNAINLQRNNMTLLAAVDPLIVNYQLLDVRMPHSAASSANLYKCANWNFTDRSCIGSFAWQRAIPDGATFTNVSLNPGDPALGIYQPTTTQGPSGPAGPAGGAETPAGAPAAVGLPYVQTTFYIGDFAKEQNFTVWMNVGETWIFTFKGANHTVEEMWTSDGVTELRIDHSYFIPLELNKAVQIDADNNDMPDIKFTLNQMQGTKINVTLQLPPETLVVFKYFYITPNIYYLLLLIFFNMLLIDIIYMVWWERRREQKHPKRKHR